MRPEDRDGLLALHAGLSSSSARMRFFAASPSSGPRYVDHLFSDSDDVIALVAEVRGELIGLATAEVNGNTAEVSFVVADAMHGHGVGTILLERLAAACRARGIPTFIAEVLTENHLMIQVLTDAGFPATHRTCGTTCTWEIGTTPLAEPCADAGPRPNPRHAARRHTGRLDTPLRTNDPCAPVRHETPLS